MELDVAGYLGAVDRSVSEVEVEGQPARAITLVRSFATSVDDLWDALTNGERIPRWFLPISGELALGGRYQFEGNAGGVITECERPSLLAATWEFGGDVSWVEVRLSDDGSGSARLTLTHTMRLSDQWEIFGPGATGVGWEGGLVGLALHFETPDESISDEAAFTASEEGKAFYAGSSEAWGEAAVAFGDNPAAARAAARRTSAFYTGEPEEPA
ncbi:MAG: SRPBCC family protein [Dehalococcoidia bacterium]|nr:SRPBCC family protein [Dehalococcoidia bacterium]